MATQSTSSLMLYGASESMPPTYGLRQSKSPAPSTLIQRFPVSSFLTSTDAFHYTLLTGDSGTYLLYQPDKLHSQFAADVPAEEAALMLATQRPMDQLCLTEAPTRAAWTYKPTWLIITTQEYAIPVAEQKFEADRAKSHVTEVDSSHTVTVSNPDVVAQVIRMLCVKIE